MAGHNKDVDGPTPLIKRDALLGLIDRSAPAQAHVHTVPRERLRARTGDVVAEPVDGDVDVDIEDLSVDLDNLELDHRGLDHRGVGHVSLDDLDLHKRYVENLEFENRYIDHRDLDGRDLDRLEEASVKPLRARAPYQDLDEEIGPSVSPLLVLGVIALLIVTFIAATQLR